MYKNAQRFCYSIDSQYLTIDLKMSIHQAVLLIWPSMIHFGAPILFYSESVSKNPRTRLNIKIQIK